jgi:hypothetical protein
MRKKLCVFIVLVIASTLIIACSNKKEETESNDETVTNIDENGNEKELDTSNNNVTSEENEEELESKNEKSQEAKEGGLDFSIYRPELGSERVFTENGETVYTEKVIAENQDYIQLLVTLGGSKTTEIYKWNEDEVTLVFQDFNLDNSEENMLNSFESNIAPKKIFGNESEWEVLNENESLEVDGKIYDNVYVIKRVSDEVVDADTIIKRYYAPNSGLIKEEVEVTGDKGYKSTVILSN